MEHPQPPTSLADWIEYVDPHPHRNSGEGARYLSLTYEQLEKFIPSATPEQLSYALVWASQHNDMKEAKLLLESGASVSAPVAEFGDRTPLKAAMIAGEEMARYLLTQGADIHEPGLIMTAALYGHLELVKLLLMAGVDYTVPINGETVIKACEERGDHKAAMLKFLTEEGPKLLERAKNRKEAKVEAPATEVSSASTASVATTSPSGGQIMLSYQWDDQPTILKLKEALTSAGFKVWLDLEQMGGSTLEAMADAVESSTVICVALSDKYKNSANCRLEGEYSQQQKKRIIPLMMEKGYRPSGWLGLLVGAKLYFEFTDKAQEAFTQKLGELIKELRRYITPGAPVEVKSNSIAVPVSAPEAKALAPPAFSLWSVAEAMAWAQQLGCEASTFKNPLDGACLEELSRLRSQDSSLLFINFLLIHINPHPPCALKLSRGLATLR